jgi:hypothetical protein
MVKDYRKKVGSKTGGIKLYNELKKDFIDAGIKIGRDKFYRFLRVNNLLVPKTKNYMTHYKLKPYVQKIQEPRKRPRPYPTRTTLGQ